MEFKITFANGRQTYVDADNEKELKSELDKLVKTFGSDVSKVSAMDEKFSIGGFITGTLLGGYFGNEVAKNGLQKTAKKTAKSVVSTSKRTFNKAKKEVAGFKKASTRKYETGGFVRLQTEMPSDKVVAEHYGENISKLKPHQLDALKLAYERDVLKPNRLTKSEAKSKREKEILKSLSEKYDDLRKNKSADQISEEADLLERDGRSDEEMKQEWIEYKFKVHPYKNVYATGGTISKQSDGSYIHPSGFKIEPYDDGRYILLDPDGMDAVGESMTLAEAKQTLLDNVESGHFKTGGKVKNFPIAIKRKIDEINAMLPKVKDADDVAGGYFGSTHYSYVSLLKPIEIKGQYVYIYPQQGLHYMSFEKRYNVNKVDEEWGGKKHLLSDLAKISKAFKGVLKNEFALGGKTPIQFKGYTINYINGEYRADTYAGEQFSNKNLSKLKSQITQHLISEVKKQRPPLSKRSGGGKYETGGGVDAFNPRSFTIDELYQFLKYGHSETSKGLYPFEDISIRTLRKGHYATTPYKDWEILVDGSLSFKSQKWANKKLTISDYGDLHFSKGDENLYLDLIVYAEDEDEELTLSIYTKENHQGLKDLSKMLIQKFETGGGVGKYEYKTINTRSASGLKEAERLKSEGWKIISTGFDTIQFERLKTTKKMSTGGSAGSNTTDMNYNEILAVLKEKLDDAVQELPNDYEQSYDAKGEEVEHQSRDGFIAYTDGGYEVTWFEYMSMFHGAGRSLPTKNLDQEMQRQIDYNYQIAKERFVEEYPEIVEELGEDNIDYHSLYEAGYESEAEQLSEWEMDFDGNETIMCEIGAYYYTPDNYRSLDGQHTIRLFGLVNLEAPYHRRGNLDDSHDIDITFNSIEELKEKVDAGLIEILNWFGGMYYESSDREMKIRKMETGGGIDKTFVGGNLSEWDLQSLNSGIRIKHLNEMLMQKFPDAFGLEIYEAKNPTQYRNLTPDKEPYGGIKNDDLKVYFDKHHSLHYSIYQGGENTYFNFALEGDDNKGYIGSFGFKDQGDVEDEYVTSFVVFLHKAYGQPFKVNHEVYGTGGGVGSIKVGDKVNLSEIKMPDGRTQFERVERGEVLYINDGIYGVKNPKTNRIHQVRHDQIESVVPKANLGMLLVANHLMQNRQQRLSDPNYRSRWEDRGLDYRNQQPMMYPQQPMQPQMQPPMGQPMGQPMYARGGSVGSEVTFKHWDGTTKTGTIVEIFPDGSMDVSCGFGHCLVNQSDVVGAEKMAKGSKVKSQKDGYFAKRNNTYYEFTWTEDDKLIINGKSVNPNDYVIVELDNQGNEMSDKMARGSKVSEYYGIKENNVITEKQMNLIKNRLNAGKKDAELEDIVQYIWDNAPNLTPDQNKKGHDFLMNLWKSPTGKERVNNPFGMREQEALEQFDHFALAGFHDASRYGQRPYYIPLYDVYMKDGEYGFQYYYNGEVNIVGAKGMKVPSKAYRNNLSRMSKSELLDYCKKNNIPCASGWDKDQILDIIDDVHASRYGKGGKTIDERMYNFLEEDLSTLEQGIEENDQITIRKFFSYWIGKYGHLKSLKTNSNERMYNFLEEDLSTLEQAIEEKDQETIEKFFSYWRQHLSSIKFGKGGSTAGWHRDRKFVDKGAKHEVRYAKSHSGRSGYNSNEEFGVGGGVRTNSKEVREKVRKHILDSVYDYEENQFPNFQDASQHLTDEFKRVADHPYNLKRFPNNQKRFQDYLQGIPFNFEFENYKIEEFLNGLGINPSGKEYSSDQMWHLYSYLIWREVEPTYRSSKFGGGGKTSDYTIDQEIVFTTSGEDSYLSGNVGGDALDLIDVTHIGNNIYSAIARSYSVAFEDLSGQELEDELFNTINEMFSTNDQIDVELELVRLKYAKGGSTAGWHRDRMFVNKGQGHEKSYSKGTGRSGYKDAKYGTGGGVGSSNPFVKVLLEYGFKNQDNLKYFYHQSKNYYAILDLDNKKIEVSKVQFLDAPTFKDFSVDKLENFLIKKGFKKSSKFGTGGGVRKAPFKVGDMVYSYQNPNHKMRVSFVEDRGVIDGVDYGWGIKVALKTDADGKYDPNGTYSQSSKWMSQNSVSKTKKEKYETGGTTGSKFYVVDNRELTFGSSKPVVATFDTREEARADAKDRNKIYDADTKMFSVMTANQLKAEGVTEFGGGGSAGSKVINDLSREEAERLFALAHPKYKVGDRVWNNFKRTPVQLVYTQLEEKGVKFGTGGTTDKPKEPIAFETSNLYYNGKGRDVNGNKVVRVSFANGRAFSIQTNGVLPKTHKDGYDEKEINQYVKEYGSDAQKKKLKCY